MRKGMKRTMDIFAIIRLLGGLALFLYGIEIMGEGLKRSTGAALKRVLEKATTNVVLGVLTGTLVTAVIQSSTATIVLTVALIGAGILNLKQAVSIVLGANIGTTVTAQIIRLMDIDSAGNLLLELCSPESLAPIALVVGIILIMFVKRPGAKGVADIFVGFGVLFTGLLNMTSAVKPLSESAAFAELLARFSGVPVLGLAAGMVLTVIVQSSSAMVGMLQALSTTGAMTFSLVYPIIMGINLGTCVTTAAVCSIGTGRDAKRTGVVHIAFNTIGTILFMIVMTILKNYTHVFPEVFWTRIVNSGDIADFQTLFNLITAIVLLPFTDQLVKLSKLIVKDEKPQPQPHPELQTLDEKLFVSPTVALAEATRAVTSMGQLALENFSRASGQLLNYDDSLDRKILVDEECLDQFADVADHFLVDLSKLIETQHDNLQLNMLMQSVPNFERIGDYATNFLELAQRLRSEKIVFSETAQRELRLLRQAVQEIIQTTVAAFQEDSDERAKQIEPLEEIIDDMVLMLRNRHTDRLKSGECTISAGLVFMEVLTYMERASDQCSSTAVLLLARSNEAILRNHYEYLRLLHEGSDKNYLQQMQQRREQYIVPLEALK